MPKITKLGNGRVEAESPEPQAHTFPLPFTPLGKPHGPETEGRR